MKQPFVRKYHVDCDELVAARWWHEGMTALPRRLLDPQTPVEVQTRRAVLIAFGVVGGAVGLGLLKSASEGRDDPQLTLEAIKLQRDRGWNVGASEKSLVYTPVSGVDAAGQSTWHADLEGLAMDLAPRQPALLGYYVPTLFQVLASADFRAGIVPIHSAAMDQAFARGRALVDLFADAGSTAETALLVDLPGPAAVALAAALAPRFEPVFLFDNWPHPQGVVPSHEVVAAAVYYRPLFLSAQKARPADAPPVFVIDDRRLAPYRDESDMFDNRYLARLPTAEGFEKLGVRRLLYVTDGPVRVEADDLNDDFVALDGHGIDVKMLALSDFRTVDAVGTVYSYGGSPAPRTWFWHSYGWYHDVPVPRGTVAPRPVGLSQGATFRPAPRPTIFSARTVGGLSGFGKQKPSGFGMVSVRTSRTTGAVSIGRSGSLGRAGFFSGG